MSDEPLPDPLILKDIQVISFQPGNNPGDIIQWDGTSWQIVSAGPGTGDVNGPVSSTDNAVTRWNGTTGSLIQNSIVTLSDLGVFNTLSSNTNINSITGVTQNSFPILYQNTTNLLCGINSLLSLTSGAENTAVGNYSLNACTTGTDNTSVGSNSLLLCVNGYYNSALGSYAGSDITSGSNNILLGRNTKAGSATASNRVVIGVGGTSTTDNSLTVKGSTNITGFYFPSLSGPTSTSNVLYYNSISGQITYGAVGVSTYEDSTFRIENSIDNTKKFGFSCTNISTGTTRILTVPNSNGIFSSLNPGTTANSLITGPTTFTSSPSGSNNTGYGVDTLKSATTGSNNTSIGYNNLSALTIGTLNTILGSNTGIDITTGSNNILLGANSTAGSAASSNRIVIGTGGDGISDNSLTIKGTTPITKVYVPALGTSTTTDILYFDSATGLITYGAAGYTGSVFLDNLFRIQDNGDNTKQFAVECSNITTGTTRTFTIPNANGILPATNPGTSTNSLITGSTTFASAPSGANNIGYGISILSVITSGSDNTSIGYNTLSSLTTGSNNIGIGSNSLKSTTIGSQNTSIGSSSLETNISGVNNTSIGYNSLNKLTNASNTTSIGALSLQNLTTGGNNTSIGYLSLSNLTTASGNVSFGNSSLSSNITGDNNTSVGYLAGSNITSTNNTAIGQQALSTCTTGTDNIGIGSLGGGGVITGSRNVSIGNGSPTVQIGSGNNNILLGFKAGVKTLNDSYTLIFGNIPGNGSNTTTIDPNYISGPIQTSNNLYYNTVNGQVTYGPINSNISSFGAAVPTLSNTAGGTNSLGVLSGVATNVLRNTAFGALSLAVLTDVATYNDNTAFGYNALGATTTANNNTAIGSNSLSLNISGVRNTALGSNSLLSNTTSNDNVAIGFNALSLVNDTRNTAIGANALKVSTASDNTAIGYNSLISNTSGSFNTSIGVTSLASNTTGNKNTSVGYNTLNSVISGSQNTSVGYQSLFVNTNSNNTAIGNSSLSANTTGTNNTAIGNTTGATLTTGSNNILIGSISNVDTAARSNVLVIGASTTSIAQNNSTVIGTSYVRNIITSDVLYYNSVNGEVSFGSNAGVSTFLDSLFRIQDNVDTTKQFAVECSNITTGTTRTFTIPNANGILPVINLGTSTNTLITGPSTFATAPSGTGNSGYGVGVLEAITTGQNNTAVGLNTLKTVNTGSFNTSLGSGALLSGTTASLNIALGYNSLSAVTTGNSNIALGTLTGSTLTTGSNNILIGPSTNVDNAARSNVIVIGSSSTSVAADNSMVIGSSYLRNNTATNFLYYNSSTGEVSYSPTSGFSTFLDSTFRIQDNGDTTKQFAVECSNITTGTTRTFTIPDSNGILPATNPSTSTNTLITGRSTYASLPSGSGNSGYGIGVFAALTSGANNTSIGLNTLASNTTGSQNVAVGSGSLTTNSTASGNTGVGFESLKVNTTGANNVAIGLSSLIANILGSQNVAIGANSLAANTSANGNVAIGFDSLKTNTIGIQNVGIGSSVLAANTTANSNTGVGFEVLKVNSTGTQNVGVGTNALIANTTSNNNTAIGFESLKANSTGAGNTALGSSSLITLTTGSNNTVIGYNSANAVLTTGSGNILIGASTAVDNLARSNTIVIGNSSTSITADNSMVIGTSYVRNVASTNFLYYNSTTGEVSYSPTSGVSTFLDSTFRIQDNGDTTKQFAVECSGITTGTTRTFTIPNANGVLPAINPGTATSSLITGPTTFASTPSGSGVSGYGSGILAALTTATNVTAIGFDSLKAVTIGGSNTALGASTGATLTTGTGNILIGASANVDNLARSNTIVIGNSTTSIAADNSTVIGTSYVRNTTSTNLLYYNSSTGEITYSASNTLAPFLDSTFRVVDNADTTKQFAVECSGITTGTTRTFTIPNANGVLPAINPGTATSSLITGPTTFASAPSGSGVSGYGSGILAALTTAANVTAIGFDALKAVTIGGSNTALGASTGATLTTGTGNILIGVSANVDNLARSNTIVIGNSATSAAQNGSMVIGTSYVRNTTANNLLYYNSSTGEVSYNVDPASVFLDSVFRVVDNGDTTKQFAVECSGITTGTTRTFTIPNANGVLPATNPGTATNSLITGPTTFASAPSGSGNTGYGMGVLATLTTGANNTVIGYNSANAVLTTGSGNILIGASTAVDNLARSNTIVIGNSTTSIAADNSIVIGTSYVRNTTSTNLLYYNSSTGEITYSASNTLAPFLDSTFRVVDNGDVTKQFAFECSGITTGTTRTFTIPNANGVLPAINPGTATSSLITGPTTFASAPSGSGTTGYGSGILAALTTAANVTAIGFDSLKAVTIGGSNTALGASTGATLTTGTGNILIGAAANVDNLARSNTIVIGNSATSVAQNGSMVIGTSYVRNTTASNLLYYNSSTGEVSYNVDPASVFLDSVFRVVDNGDTTKQFAVECSGITTGTTRTFTIPNANGVLPATNPGTATNSLITGPVTFASAPSGSGNTGYGMGVLATLTTGANNTVIGYNSANAVLTTGSGNILIGASTAVDNLARSNTIVIGASTTSIAANNSLVIGTSYVRNTNASNLLYYNSSTGEVSYSASNTLAPFLDSTFRVVDNGDVTKQFAVECSGITTGTTRTFTIPNANGVLPATNPGTATSSLITGPTTFASAPSGSGVSGYGSGILAALTTAANVTAIGFDALKAVTTGGSNTALGASTGATLTTGTGNILIGVSANVDNLARSNTIVIGNSATSAAQNGSMVIGTSYVRNTTSTNLLYYNSSTGEVSYSASNTLAPFLDSTFRVVDNGDTTKQFAVECSGITTGTTRTFTIPNANGVLPATNPATTTNSLITGPTTFASAPSGSGNTGYGMGVLATLTTGANNTVIGYNSANAVLTTGSGNILIGASTAVDNLARSNTIVIGASTTSIAANNSTVIGTSYVRNTTSSNLLYYNSSTGEISYGAATGFSTFLDSTFRIQDNLDTTKQFAVECSDIATGNTRTFTIPNANGVFSAVNPGTATNSLITGPTTFASAPSGSGNTGYGMGILAALTTGANNTVIGYNSANAVLTTGSGNILIGASTAVDNLARSNTIVIGNSTTSIAANNSTVIGTSYVRNVSTTNLLYYNSSTGEVSYSASNTLAPFLDNTFRVVDNGDVTKQFAVECSGITTGTTRTFTIPNANGVLPATNPGTATNSLITGPVTFTSAPSGSGVSGYGSGILAALTTAVNVTAIGLDALKAVTIGGSNTALGASTGATLTTGTGNILIGVSANVDNLARSNTIVIGNSATSVAQNGSMVIGTSYVRNVVSTNLLYYNSSTGEVSYSTDPGSTFLDTLFRVQDNGDTTKQFAVECSNISSGTTRTFTIPNANGVLPAINPGTATSSLITGPVTFTSAPSGSGATGYGSGVLAAITTGANVTAIGLDALKAVTTGGSNTALGASTGATLTTGTGNILIGASANVDNLARSNTIVIGNSSTSIAADNSIVIGTSYVRNVSSSNLLYYNSSTGEVSYSASSGISTFLDSTFRIQDNGDTTKQFAVECSGITTGTTRTFTIPNANGVLTASNPGSTTFSLITGPTTFTSAPSGTGNAGYGVAVLINLTSGSFNTAIGCLSSGQLTTGTNNTSVGYATLNSNTASYNTSMGSEAALFSTTGNYNSSFGYRALYNNTTGARNTCIGANSGSGITTGTDNIYIGYNSPIPSLTTGSNNILIGSSAKVDTSTRLNTLVIGNSATSVDDGSMVISPAYVRYLSSSHLLYYNPSTGEVSHDLVSGISTFLDSTFRIQDNGDTTKQFAVECSGITTGTTRTFTIPNSNGVLPATDPGTTTSSLITGPTTFASAPSGAGNTGYGIGILIALTTGANNTAMGLNSLASNTTGANNTAFGSLSLNANSTASGNTAIGFASLASNITGANNTALGSLSLNANSTASGNTGIGYESLRVNTTGTNNTALGASSLAKNSTASGNTGIGFESLKFNTTGANNTALGSSSLNVNSTASGNTGIGFESLKFNTTGTNNTALGTSSLAANSTASGNTGIGFESLKVNTTGADNTGLGISSLIAVTTGNNNTALGSSSLQALTVGSNNIAIGYNSSNSSLTNGSDNILIGASTAVDFYARSNVIVIGSSSTSVAANNSTVIGTNYVRNTTSTNLLYYNSSTGEVSYGASNALTPFLDSTFRIVDNGDNTKQFAVECSGITTGTTRTFTIPNSNGILPANNPGTTVNTLITGPATFASVPSGSNNTGYGIGVLTALTSGNNNIAIGYNSANSISTGGANILIGASTSTDIATRSNTIVIGNSTTSVAANNSMVISPNYVRDVFTTKTLFYDTATGEVSYHTYFDYWLVGTTGTIPAALGGKFTVSSPSFSTNANWYEPSNYAGYIMNNKDAASNYGLLVSDYRRNTENYVFAVDGRTYVDGTILNDTHNPYFVVQGTGNIGISTASPSYKLHVVGDIYTTTQYNTANCYFTDGLLNLNKSVSNLINFNQIGVNTPTFTSQSVGTKINLYSGLSASSVDYSIGISSGALWCAVPQSVAGNYFKWFGGQTEICSLNGVGLLKPADSVHIPGNGTMTDTSKALDLYQNYGGYRIGFDDQGATRGYIRHNIVGNGSDVYGHIFSGSLSGTPNVFNNALFIGNSQNIGIGTVAPSYKLHVVGDLYTTTNYRTANSYMTDNLISLNNGTSNLINFGQNGSGAPTFTSRSAGTKLVIYNGITGSSTDYGIGIESLAMWFNIATNDVSQLFKWYGGTTNVMTLTGNGILQLKNAGGFYTGLKCHASTAANTTFALPQTDATVVNTPLVSDAAGNLSFGQTLASGNYTATTISAVTVFTPGTIVVNAFYYTRVGNYVSCSIQYQGSIAYGGGGLNASFELTLPIEPTSNFSNIYDACGNNILDWDTGASAWGQIKAVTSSKRIIIIAYNLGSVTSTFTGSATGHWKLA